MYNDDYTHADVDVPAGNLDVEASELPPVTDPEFPPVEEPVQPSAGELIAIYKLLQAGFVPSDFE